MAMLTAYDPFAATSAAFRALDQLTGRSGSIDLSVEGNTLTVSAERSVPQLENAEWAIAERPFGSYTRQLVLGRSLDTDRLEASYHDGVLTLSIPVAEKAKARKITVTRADAPEEHRTIEGEQSSSKAVEA